MEKSLTFSSINIIRVPGFNPPGFNVKEIKPQINIVYGPNAIGKSTMARAFSYLIWPQAEIFETLENISLQGSFTLNDFNWFVEIDAGKIKYQKDGVDSPRPPFPPVEHRDRYYIALHDLLQKDTDDKSFAEIIIKESAGGYQISEAVEDLGFKDKPSRKGRTTRYAQNKIRGYQQVIKKQKQLIDEERHLERLYKELNEIKNAQKHLEIVKQVIEYSRVDNEYREVKTQFEKYPSVLSKITGDEEERLKRIEENIEKYKAKKENAESKYCKAKKVIQEVDLAGKGVRESFLTKIKNKNEKLKIREEKIVQLQNEIKEAQTKRKEEEKNFIDLIQEKKLAEIDSATYNQLSKFARRAEEVHNKLLSFESLKNLLEPEEEYQEKETIIQNGIKCLEDWLQVPEEKTNEQNKVRNVSLISGLIIMLMTIYMGMIINPGFLILIIIPFTIFWYGVIHNNKEIDYKKLARQEFEQLDLKSQKEWKKPAIKARLRELYDLEAKIKLYKRRKQYWEDRKKEYNELQKKNKEINREREELIKHFGVAPDTDEQTLYHLTNRLSRWQDAHIKLQGLQKKLKYEKETYGHLLDELNKMLVDYGYQTAFDSAEISGNITDLEERNSKFQVAIRDRERAEESLEETKKKLKEADVDRKQIYSKLDLELDNKTKLRELCNQYNDFLQTKDELLKIEHLWKVERAKLEDYTVFDQSLLEKDLAELKVRMKELKNKAEEYQSTQDKISNIEARIDSAREDRSIENAFTDRERALDKLEEQLYNDYEKLTGNVLADYIREVNTVQNRPEVFKKARKIFTTITRGNYKLEINNYDPPSFRAIETVSGKGKHLDELSSGTRIQLLLAVRIAFVDQKEEGLILPLFLDETLANADDRRAESIIQAVIELVRNGRQCFYFTAQQDEVSKWLSIIEGESNVNANVIDLSESKSEGNPVFNININKMLSDINMISATDDMSHDDYREALSVPVFDPRQGANSIHIWYLIEDIKLIEHFIKLGIEKWGQLKTLLEIGKEGIIPADKKRILKEVQELGCCLEEFVDCWKVGQGKLVDRSVLLASNAVTDNFIDDVFRLAKEVDGDASSIIRELRNGTVARFLSKKIDDLEEFFEEENYIAVEDKLSEEQIYLRMLSVINLNNMDQAAEKIRRLLERLIDYKKK